MENRVQRLVRIAAVAAIYVAATLLVAPLAFGPVQFRFSEVLVLLCFYRKDYGYALTLGCAVANLFSPLGLVDVVFGSLATALSAFAIYRCRSLLIASFFPTLGCVIVGVELHLLTEAPLIATCLMVMAGELVVVTGLGWPLFRFLGKKRAFLTLLRPDREIPASR